MAMVGGLAAIPAIPFFCAQYGGFMFGHLMFILFLTEIGPERLSGDPPWTQLPSIMASTWIAVAALFLSHGISFGTNFIGRRECKRLKLPQLFIAPYVRIVVMHVSIIVGAFGIVLLGSPMFMLILLVLLKTAVDVAAHLAEHRKAAEPD